MPWEPCMERPVYQTVQPASCSLAPLADRPPPACSSSAAAGRLGSAPAPPGDAAVRRDAAEDAMGVREEREERERGRECERERKRFVDCSNKTVDL